jgi:Ser/Thr protein kinase RdoA (MazF antagonist)
MRPSSSSSSSSSTWARLAGVAVLATATATAYYYLARRSTAGNDGVDTAVTHQTVARLLAERYGIVHAFSSSSSSHAAGGKSKVRQRVLWRITDLPSYDDLNFRIDVRTIFKADTKTTTTDEAYVLKFNVCGAGGDAELRLENAAMDHLRSDPRLCDLIPCVIPARCKATTTANFNSIFRFTTATQTYHVRLLTFLRGDMLADVPLPQRTPDFMGSIGTLLGSCDAAFANGGMPQEHIRTASSRNHFWDLRNAPNIRGWTSSVNDLDQRRLLEAAFDKFLEHGLPYLADEASGGLRAQLVHNDANDNNIVVTRVPPFPDANSTTTTTYTVSGLIDFGDAVHTTLVNNLAIAMAYCCCVDNTSLAAGLAPQTRQAQADYARAQACALVRAYHQVMPLEERECDALWWLMLGRVCHSLSSSAKRAEGEPGNVEYIRISEAPFWRLLDAISVESFEEHARQAREELRRACLFS